MKVIAGKKAIVTGAASGIGRAIACALAREQAELCLIDVDAAGLEMLAAELREQGTRVLAWRCDLTDRDDLDACLNQLLIEWGGVDIVINNAGRAFYGPADSITDAQWDSLVAVNLLAPAQIIRRLLPTLKQRGEAQIVNIASIAGLVAFKRVSAYCLTKFGLVGFSESLRSELAKFGVGVTVVCPGFVRTRLFSSTMTAKESRPAPAPSKWISIGPEVVAERVLHAIHRNRATVVLGFGAHTAWLIKRLWPNFLPALMGGFRRVRPTAKTTPAVESPLRQHQAA